MPEPYHEDGTIYDEDGTMILAIVKAPTVHDSWPKTLHGPEDQEILQSPLCTPTLTGLGVVTMA